jgi:hypothetical protein
MKNVFLFVIICFSFSCKKQNEIHQLNEYFKFKVNGQTKAFGPGNALNNGQFECAFLGDTVLFIAVKWGFESVGIYIKANPIADGTYSLDDINQGSY